ncbi:hypothetical protein LT85_2259 [Collimonas arenae]|uniref:HutD family protein n=1 Tax=Collimonas arenae TaxID=279058 RepID=A0A0A1FEZ7_9BURK|nr:HutD family protein [Collimonas arenae]AIY41417.1 hypothetical protein LT85_2259 [Collimonas arenae]
MKLIQFEDLPATRWKNGGGITRELYSYPAASTFDNFVWRVSIADVSQSGAFSSFPGVDRIITLLEGEGMQLLDDSGNHALLSLLQPHRFRGEAQISARLEGGACQDFNLMLRRGAAIGAVEIWRGDQNLPQGCNLLFCARGRWDVLTEDGEHATLDSRQSLVWEAPSGRVSLRSLSAGSILIGVNINLQ